MLVVLVFFSVNAVNAQIVSGNVGDEDEGEIKVKKEKTKVNRDSLSGTTFYLTGLYTYTDRTFEDKSAYGAFASWADQMPDHSGGASLGLFLPLSKLVSLDLGISYFAQKEKFNYADPDSDSTFAYTNGYMYLGLPVKIRFTYGDRFQLFGYAGLTPMNLLNIRYKESYTRVSGAYFENEVELVKNKIAGFNLQATVGGGIAYNFDWFGLTLYPEFRQNLLNTYNLKTKPLLHRQFGLGVHCGVTLRF